MFHEWSKVAKAFSFKTTILDLDWHFKCIEIKDGLEDFEIYQQQSKDSAATWEIALTFRQILSLFHRY